MAFDSAAGGGGGGGGGGFGGGGARRASTGASLAPSSSASASAGSSPADGSADSLAGLARKVWEMSQSCASVDSLSAGLGGPSDTVAARARIEGHERRALELQAELDAGLRRLRVALIAGTDHTAQRQLKRLEEQYAEARERLARALGDSRIRRRQFAPLAPPPAAAATASSTASAASASGLALSSSLSSAAAARGRDDATGPQHVRLELQGLSAVDAAIMEERSEEAMAIARASSALQRTQQDLSALVTEQGETLAHVEAGVEKAVESVVAGTRVLVEAQALQSHARCKYVCAGVLLCGLVAAIAVPLALHYTPGSAILQ